MVLDGQCLPQNQFTGAVCSSDRGIGLLGLNINFSKVLHMGWNVPYSASDCNALAMFGGTRVSQMRLAGPSCDCMSARMEKSRYEFPIEVRLPCRG